MLKALPQAGWHINSLILRDDGSLIGYLETLDFVLLAALLINVYALHLRKKAA